MGEKEHAAVQHILVRGVPDSDTRGQPHSARADWEGSVCQSSSGRNGASNLPPLGGIPPPSSEDAPGRLAPYSAVTPRKKRYQYVNRGIVSPVQAYRSLAPRPPAEGQTTQLLFLPSLPLTARLV